VELSNRSGIAIAKERYSIADMPGFLQIWKCTGERRKPGYIGAVSIGIWDLRGGRRITPQNQTSSDFR